MEIRDATKADLPSINAIYNEVLLSSTAIYSDRPVTLVERETWWRERREMCFPVLLAEEQGAVAGFAALGEFRSWPGYRFTVEGTLHIAPEWRRKRIGRELLDALVARARALEKHVLIAGVDSENTASLAFLESYGFERGGVLREVGFKFGRFLDLHLLQYAL